MLLSFLLAFSFFSSEPKKDNAHFYDYLEFVRVYDHLGEVGNYKDGKIEIVLEEKTVRKIEETQAKSYMKEGESEKDAHDHSKIGIVARDKYWVWIRDAVIFPSGSTGTFNRIVKSGSLDQNINNCVGILPVNKDGKIILNLMYRHAIRDWVVEMPRGKIEKDETVLNAAKRELREETGAVAFEFEFLGEVTPDSGTVSSRVPIYLGRVDKRSSSNKDISEAICGIVELSINEVKKAFVKGYLEVVINNEKKKVFVKDSYLSYAILIAEQKKII